MRVGIRTFHRAHNCGAMLQAWALKTILERWRHIVEFPRIEGYFAPPRQYGLVSERKLSGIRRWRRFVYEVASKVFAVGFNNPSYDRYEWFQKKWLPEQDVGDDFARRYDIVVLGSDQIWNLGLVGELAPSFLGEDIPDKLPHITYAASCGDALPPSSMQRRRLLSALQGFKAVSVRERTFATWLSQESNSHVEFVVDPTLLLLKDDYSQLENIDNIPSRPYLFAYANGIDKSAANFFREIAKKCRLPVIIAPTDAWTRLGLPGGMTLGISPDSFLGFIKECSGVIASSFHGAAFSIIYQKPFVCYKRNRNIGQSRVWNLLNEIGETNRLVSSNDSLNKIASLLQSPISLDAEQKLGNLRVRSMAWLKANLK